MSFTLDALFQTLSEGSTLINSTKRIQVSIRETRKATCASFRQGASSMNIQKYAY